MYGYPYSRSCLILTPGNWIRCFDLGAEVCIGKAACAEEELNTNVEKRESRRSGWLLAKTAHRGGLFLHAHPSGEAGQRNMASFSKFGAVDSFFGCHFLTQKVTKNFGPQSLLPIVGVF